MEELIIKKVPTFANRALQKATEEIYKVGDTMRKCAFRTAAIMASVAKTECYKEDGFDSVHDWAMKTFGFKKSVSYTLLKIGNEYIREIKNPETGKVKGYMTDLVPENSERDFGTTQIEKMLPLGHAVAQQLCEEGEITPAMTCKEIGEVVRDYLKEDEEPEETATEEAETEESAEEATPAELVTVAIVFADGNIGTGRYAIPVDVLKEYEMTIS